MRIINLAMLEEMITACEKAEAAVDETLKEFHAQALGRQELRRSSKENTWLNQDAMLRYAEFAFNVTMNKQRYGVLFDAMFMADADYASINAILAFLVNAECANIKMLKRVADCTNLKQVHTACFKLQFDRIQPAQKYLEMLFDYQDSASSIADCLVVFGKSPQQVLLYDVFQRYFPNIKAIFRAVGDDRHVANTRLSYDSLARKQKIGRFIDSLKYLAGIKLLTPDLLRLMLKNFSYADEIFSGVCSLWDAGLFHGEYRDKLFQSADKAALVGTIFYALPDEDCRLAFARINLKNYSYRCIFQLRQDINDLQWHSALTLPALQTLLDALKPIVQPTCDLPALTLNGKAFVWQDYLKGGPGQIKAKEDAIAYREMFKRCGGLLFAAADERLEEESEYITLDDELEVVTRRSQCIITLDDGYDDEADEESESEEEHSNTFHI